MLLAPRHEDAVMGQPVDIRPLQGLGEVGFEMTYDQVEALLGKPHGYEDWMGGNLNGTMIYPSTMMEFDHCDSHRPTRHARIEVIEGRPHETLTLWGRPLLDWDLAALCHHADLENWQWRVSEHGEFEAPRLRLLIGLDAIGHPNYYCIESPWCVGWPTMRSDLPCSGCPSRHATRPFRELHLTVFEERMLREANRRNGSHRRFQVEAVNPSRPAAERGEVLLWDLELIGRRGKRYSLRPLRWRGRKALATSMDTLRESWICDCCGRWQ